MALGGRTENGLAARIRRTDGPCRAFRARLYEARIEALLARGAGIRTSMPSPSMATASMRPTSPISPATTRASRKRCWSSSPAARRSFSSATRAGAMPKSAPGPTSACSTRPSRLPAQPRDRSAALRRHPCRLRPASRPAHRRHRLEAVRAGRPRLRRDGARPALLHRRHAARRRRRARRGGQRRRPADEPGRRPARDQRGRPAGRLRVRRDLHLAGRCATCLRASSPA